MSNKNVYFAALPKEEIGAELEKREQNWYQNLSSTGIYDAVRRCYKAYYGENSVTKNGKITSVGEQGNLKVLVFNEYRNFLQHILAITTQSRLNPQPRAVNSDHKSMAQAILAKSLLDGYVREKDLQGILSDATEYALSTTEGFTKLDWRPELGERTFEENTNGDIEYRTFPGVDVIRDPKKKSSRKQQWFIIKDKQNRYDLMAKYPELAEEIANVGYKTDDEFNHSAGRNIFEETLTDVNDEDDVYVKEFWHDRTEAMPSGRLVIYIDSKIILYDGPLPYEKSHMYRITPNERLGTTHGYSVALDMLPLQELLDALVSSVTTNMTNFGTQNLAVKNGDGFNLEQLGGLNVLKYNTVKPEAINLEATPPQVVAFIQNIRGFLETITGISSIQRGNVPEGVTAGSAMALIQAQSIQFNSVTQRNYAKHSEDVFTGTIDLLKQFGTEERTVYIIGENNRGYMKSFTSDDIAGVSRVVIELSNPLEATYAGRKQMSDEWLTKGLITPKQQLLFIRSGNLEQATDRDEKEMMLIKLENEKLAEGKDVIVLDTDLHLEHILDHKSVLSDPDVRDNPDIVAKALEHIHLHLTALAEVNPDLLQMLGQPVLGMPAGGAPMPPENGGELPPPEGGEVPFTDEVEQNNLPPVPGLPQGDLPNMPTNPLTGEQA